MTTCAFLSLSDITNTIPLSILLLRRLLALLRCDLRPELGHPRCVLGPRDGGPAGRRARLLFGGVVHLYVLHAVSILNSLRSPSLRLFHSFTPSRRSFTH